MATGRSISVVFCGRCGYSRPRSLGITNSSESGSKTMSGAVYRLMRTTVALLLLVSLSGFLPAAAHAQHLVRARSTSPAEEGPPGKAEEINTDAFHATLSKRIRSVRNRSKTRHFLPPNRFSLL